MKIINIKVTDKLKVTGIVNGDNTSNSNIPVKIASGNYKSIILNFEFDNTIWDDNLEKYATFSVENQEGIQVKLEKIDKYENACYVPFSVLKQNCKINVGAYGTITNDDNVEKIISTENLYFLVVDGSFSQYLVDETPVDIEKIKLLKDEIISEIDDYSKEKQNNYDENAEAKLSDYNKNCEEKLKNYNDNTIAKIKEYNSNADKKIDEYNENADDLIKLTTSTSNELYRLKTDVLETGESSGNNIHLEDSALSEMQEISIEMDKDRVQNTTTGKNLLPYPWSFISPTTLNGITITDNNDGKSFTVSGTSTDVTTFVLLRDTNKDIIKDDVAYYLQGGKSTNARLYFNTGSMDTGNGTSYTYSNESTSTRLVGVYIPSGVTINEIIYPMLSEGSEATDYEPYTGGQSSPSPDYHQEIKTLTGDIKLTSCGKNLFDKDSVNILKVFNNKSLKQINSNEKARTAYILIKPNTTYTISRIAGTRFSIGTTTNLPETGMTLNSCKESHTSSNITITTGSNDRYLTIWYYFSDTDTLTEEEIRNSIQVLQSNQATSFESYQGSSLNITIPENEFAGKIDDTYKDSLNVVYKNDGHYHLILNKIIGKAVLDGSESIWTATVEGIYTGTSSWGNKSQSKTLANYFQTFTTYNGGMKTSKNGAGFLYPNVNQYYLKIDGITTVEELKTWLSTHNTEVYYILETPYEVDLGIVDTLLTYDEITNIFTNSDLYPVINVKYYRNFIKTIQNLQVNNDTLKNELSNIESRLAALESAKTSVVDNNTTEESEVTE